MELQIQTTLHASWQLVISRPVLRQHTRPVTFPHPPCVVSSSLSLRLHARVSARPRLSSTTLHILSISLPFLIYLLPSVMFSFRAPFFVNHVILVFHLVSAVLFHHLLLQLFLMYFCIFLIFALFILAFLTVYIYIYFFLLAVLFSLRFSLQYSSAILHCFSSLLIIGQLLIYSPFSLPILSFRVCLCSITQRGLRTWINCSRKSSRVNVRRGEEEKDGLFTEPIRLIPCSHKWSFVMIVGVSWRAGNFRNRKRVAHDARIPFMLSVELALVRN